MVRRRDGLETHEKILEVAGKLFAEKGYEKTTHEEICKLAGVNIGAVNYHFQSKENLYREAWRHAFKKAIAKYPIDGGVPQDAPPGKRLRGYLASFIHRVADPENLEIEIVFRDMANPSGLLEEAMIDSMEPIRMEMTSILRELLGNEASERDIQLCEMSIMGQCVTPMVMKERHMQEPPPGFLHFTAEEKVEHIIKFSLAGLREIKKSASAGRTGEKKTRGT